jgi:hypothetical protein
VPAKRAVIGRDGERGRTADAGTFWLQFNDTCEWRLTVSRAKAALADLDHVRSGQRRIPSPAGIGSVECQDSSAKLCFGG